MQDLFFSTFFFCNVAALNKDRICESSPIELVVSPYGQWNLTPPKDVVDLHPPLLAENPLMMSLDQLLGRGHRLGRDCPPSPSFEDKWLSQVEIVTHVGPHRRLWMGPQFCFKTFRSSKTKHW